MEPTHSYRVLIDAEAMRFVLELRGKRRKTIESLIDELHANPFKTSSLQETDEVGRTIDVYLVKGFRIRTWHDKVDNHLKILSIA